MFWVIGLLLLVSTASNTTLPPFCKQVDNVVVCWLDEDINATNATVMAHSSATPTSTLAKPILDPKTDPKTTSGAATTVTTSTLVHEATIALAVVVAVAHLLKNKGA